MPMMIGGETFKRDFTATSKFCTRHCIIVHLIDLVRA